MRIFRVSNEYVEAAVHDTMKNCCDDEAYWVHDQGNKAWDKDGIEYCTNIRKRYNGCHTFQNRCSVNHFMTFCEFNNAEIYKRNPEN